MKPSRATFALLCTTLVCSFITAQQVQTINSDPFFLTGTKIEYFIDSTPGLPLQALMQKPFRQNQAEILNLGNVSHDVWIRFSITSHTQQDVYLLVIAPLLEQITLFEVTDKQKKLLFDGGINKPFHFRPIASQNWLFDLNLRKGSIYTYYIRGSSLFPFQIPIAVISKNQYTRYNQKNNLFWGFYIGVMLFAFIYNFLIYISVKERSYLYYILYILSSTVFYLGLQGYAFELIWPNKPYFNKLLPVIIMLTNAIVILFVVNFLAITKKHYREYYLGIALIFLIFIVSLINIAGLNRQAIALAQLISLISCSYYIYAGIVSLRRGIPNARFYLIAWTLYLVFVFIFILSASNVIPSNFFTTNCIFIGHMSEVMLLSFALADRINTLKKEKEKYQQELMKAQLEVQEQTFQSISQEIHDNLGQTLSLIKINH